VGKKPDIRRSDLTGNKSDFIALKRRVEDAKKTVVCSSFKTLTITNKKKQSIGVAVMKPI